MRDAQSLLDQLLAFEGERLTADHVYRLLGTAHVDRVIELAKAILEHDPKEALELLGRSIDEGLQLGELLDQLIAYWRDLMVVNCAGVEIGDSSVPSRHLDLLIRQAKTVALDTILAGLDVLGTTKARLRGSNHGRVLIEMALVRMSRLDDLVSLSQLTQWLNPGDGTNSANANPASRVDDRGSRKEDRGSKIVKDQDHGIGEKRSLRSEINDAASKVITPPPSILNAPPSTGANELTEASLKQIWREVLGQLGPMMAGNLIKTEGIAISGPKTLVLRFPLRYNHERDYCQETSRVARIQDAIRKVTGQTWNIRVEGGSAESPAPHLKASQAAEPSQSNYRRQRAEAAQEPLVNRALDQLGAQIVHVDDGFGGGRPETSEQQETGNVEET
jgi:DNA polymerase-3 subunit gamma/tau